MTTANHRRIAIALQAAIVAAAIAAPQLVFAKDKAVRAQSTKPRVNINSHIAKRIAAIAKHARVEARNDRQIRKDQAKRRRARVRAWARLANAKFSPKVQRLPDQRLKGAIHKPHVVIFLPRSFKAPTSLMSTQVWMPKPRKPSF